MIMTIKILATLLLGVLSGTYLDWGIIENISVITNPLLYCLLFFAGLSMGYGGNIKENFKAIGIGIIAVPILTMIGTLAGSVVAGLVLKMDILDSLAVGSGFGWYTLSAVMISKYNSQLGTIALMTNVFREIIAIIFIPVIAKNIGYLEAVSTGGATSMDTTIPSISASTDSKTVVISFFSGFIISLAVPFVVSFFLSIKYGI